MISFGLLAYCLLYTHKKLFSKLCWFPTMIRILSEKYVGHIPPICVSCFYRLIYKIYSDLTNCYLTHIRKHTYNTNLARSWLKMQIEVSSSTQPVLSHPPCSSLYLVIPFPRAEASLPFFLLRSQCVQQPLLCTRSPVNICSVSVCHQ